MKLKTLLFVFAYVHGLAATQFDGNMCWILSFISLELFAFGAVVSVIEYLEDNCPPGR